MDVYSRSTILQKDRMMTRLSYVEKHALELLSNAEVDSDCCLIQLVKLQQIFERIDDAVVTTASPVREADMHSFQAEINEYETNLPIKFADNCECCRISANPVRPKIKLTFPPRHSSHTVSTTHSPIVSMSSLFI
jgi:hypothetical protein